MIEDLTGNFHAHITFLTKQQQPQAPKGWKTTIILLEKGARKQTDVMVTRHFVVPTDKTPTIASVQEELNRVVETLKQQGHEVVRVKLEHESLPTLKPSKHNYRECHVKVFIPNKESFLPAKGFVFSRNPMETREDGRVMFVNARYRSGDIEQVDHQILLAVGLMKRLNPKCKILETKVETTVMDTNQWHDKWWG